MVQGEHAETSELKETKRGEEILRPADKPTRPPDRKRLESMAEMRFRALGRRHHSSDEFFAEDPARQAVVTGARDHVMSAPDKRLAAQTPTRP